MTIIMILVKKIIINMIFKINIIIDNRRGPNFYFTCQSSQTTTDLRGFNPDNFMNL